MYIKRQYVDNILYFIRWHKYYFYLKSAKWKKLLKMQAEPFYIQNLFSKFFPVDFVIIGQLSLAQFEISLLFVIFFGGWHAFRKKSICF